uniref:10-deacetylbaccatin III 10-O-acetyltransferase n=1 Tax=Aegilops tauschii TaxID=37682 RepID=M8CF91_AEGTA
MASSSALQFTVRRNPAVLVPPAAPTPRELKRLSDIDDQEGLRFQLPLIHFFRRHDGQDDDPALVIRGAIAAALVHYYPFAGRLRELEGRKLAVDCTGEGVLFVEADSDVRLDQFDAALGPPFPCLDELLFDVPGSSGILDSPLLLFQVTRLACGGFVMAVRIQHTMADGAGIVQLLGAIAELARGAPEPTVWPVWARQLLRAPPLDDDVLLPPRFAHREYDEVMDMNGAIVPFDFMVHRSFFIGRREISAIRSHLPPALRRGATNFEPVYAGPAKGGVGAIPGVASFFIAVRNDMGEEGIAVPVCMPGPTMDKFVEEMGKLTHPTLADTFQTLRSAI